MALETLNNRFGIRHFDEGGSAGEPTGTVSVTGAPAFDPGFYLAQNPDVAANPYFAANPYEHFTTYGQNEGRAGAGAAPVNTESSNIASANFNPQAYAEQAGATHTAPTPTTNVDIAGLYTGILGRPLDQAGLDYWTQQANQGASLDAITQAFKNSAEYKALTPQRISEIQGGLSATPGSTQAISDWYQNTLNRPADQDALANYAKAFGSTLDPSELALLNQTPEAQNRNAIINAYKNDVGRTGTPQEYDTWMQAIAGGKTLADVQNDIANSPEAQVYGAYMAEVGRRPDDAGFKYFSDRLAQGATPEQIRQEMSQTEEGKKFDINNIYKDVVGRDIRTDEVPAIMELLNQGYTIDQLRTRAYETPEGIVAQNFLKYTGRAPDAAGLKYWQDQLAAGMTKDQIAHNIALSDESINANSASVKAILQAELGADVVAGMTPEQITAYTRSILDPTRAAASGTGYATQADNLRDVYRQIALDPTLGAKLKASNPRLYEAVTPITQIDPQNTGRSLYGYFGMYNDLPILNAAGVDRMLGGGDGISDFSHGRGRGTIDIGWTSNSYSNKIVKGASALGVQTDFDENGNITNYRGLNEAAKLVGIDPSQFKDKQVQDVTKDITDDFGNVVVKGGQPVFQTDESGQPITDAKGNPVPQTHTVTADQQLYDAVNNAAKDVYSVTMDSIVPGAATEGGSKSFQTAMYQKVGDKLLAISKPVSHGGWQNADVYTGGSGFNFGRDIAPGIAFVGAAALAMVTAGQSLAATAAIEAGTMTAAEAAIAYPSVATMAGGAIGLEGTAAAVAGGAIIGGAMGAINASATGGNVGANVLGGAITGGVANAMGPLLQTSGISEAVKAVSDASNGLYSPAQISNIISSSFANAIGTAASGASGDKIMKSFGTALAANGISQAGVTAITKGLQGTLSSDTVAKIAKASQIVSNTVATSALTGKNPQQIMQSLVTQFTNPTSVVNTITSVATAKGTPPAIEPTNPFGTENVGHTTGSVDKVLQSQIMDGIANKTDDPIAFMNAAKNWTGNGSENVAFVTQTMVNQGIPADQISQDLQDLYRISAAKADEYAQYMVNKGTTKTITPTTQTATTTQQPVTTAQQPTTTAQTAVAAPQPDAYANQLFGSMVEAFNNPTYAGPAYATIAQALPSSRYDVGSSTPLVTSAGTAQTNLGGSASAANEPTSYRTYSGRPGADEYFNTYGAAFEKAANQNYIRELVDAYRADPSYAPIREELQRLDPQNPVFARSQNEEVVRTEGPAAPQQTIRTPVFKPEGSALPKPVEPPAPAPAQPEPMPATPSPNPPANDPYIVPEPMVPGRRITPIVPVSPPGALPEMPPGTLPLQDPSKVPTPDIKPLAPPTEQPVTPTPPTTPTTPVQEPVGEPERQPTPAQEQIIQQVAKTPEEAKRLETAVPRAVELITQGVPRTVAIPKVAIETGVPVEDLTTVIDATVPDVTVTPTKPTVTTPTVPKIPTTKAPTTTTPRKAGIISPFLMSQYGGIQDLAPGLTEGKNYSLSGIPSTHLDMNPTNPQNPLQQFVATSPASPLELGAQQQPDEPIQLATGGSTSTAYNPYDVSSGLSGSLTPGLTKARLDYILTGLPQSKAEGGAIQGHNPQFFSEGGLGSMNNTFVKGDGDGTSDSVPAMLANGEFVIPADVVSGLGNGSNDAGAQVLQEFLKVIREHKHSAKANKLPPKSKGPLAYLTNAKRKVKVA